MIENNKELLTKYELISLTLLSDIVRSENYKLYSTDEKVELACNLTDKFLTKCNLRDNR